MYFLITVDTEANHQRKGDDPVVLDNLNVLPQFQRLCERYGFIPTYLITQPVAEHTATAVALRGWQDVGMAEVGAHLHPWTSEPKEGGDSDMRYPSELSDEALKQKLQTLTQIITERIGLAPTSYRAGRWGYDARQGALLADLGYVVDCSITPKVNWQKMKGASEGFGGPDWRLETVRPTQRDGILEVPMTILFTGIYKKEGANWFVQMKDGLLKQALNRVVFRQKWMRIFHNTTAYDWERLYQSARKNKLPVLEFMIHSSELALGASPYTQTQEQVDHVWQQIEEMFACMRRHKVKGVSLSGFAKQHGL